MYPTQCKALWVNRAWSLPSRSISQMEKTDGKQLFVIIYNYVSHDSLGQCMSQSGLAIVTNSPNFHYLNPVKVYFSLT